MQPYFFPYIGYFALIAHSDAWVVFDVSQYTPKSWVNRNRVLHPHRGWMYVTVPLDHGSQAIPIDQARLTDPVETHRSVAGKLSHYARLAPFYREVMEILDRTFDGASHSLALLDVAGLFQVCEYLGLRFDYRMASELDLPPVDHPGGWAPAICEATGAGEYINPIGGRHLFDEQEFRRRGVEPYFLDMPPFVYSTYPYEFEAGLSILDVLMWNPPDQVMEAIVGSPVLHRGCSGEHEAATRERQ